MKYKSIIKKRPKFNGVYSRNNLPKIKDGSYLMSLDEFKPIGTHLIELYVNAETVTYFDSSWVENIPEAKFKRYKKYNNKYLLNASIRFDNVGIFLYWVCWSYVKR